MPEFTVTIGGPEPGRHDDGHPCGRGNAAGSLRQATNPASAAPWATITFAPSVPDSRITLRRELPMIRGDRTVIDCGKGAVIDGAGTYRGFFGAIHAMGTALPPTVALAACLWSGLAAATADGPDTFRVRDVRADDVLHMREAPSANAKRVGQIPPDGRGIVNLGCVQARNGRVMPHTDVTVGAPWCRVRYRGQEGWASGRFLAEDVEEAPPAKTGYPAEVGRSVGKAREGCDAFETRPGFARSDLDLNGDGVKDWVLDYGNVECDGSASMFCGSAGCTLEVFLSTRGGSFAKAFASNVQEYKILPGTPATISLALHGSACGRSGAGECRRVLRAKGAALVPDGW